MKKLSWLLVTALVLLIITACGTAETDDNTNGNDPNGSSEIVEENNGAAEEEEPVTDDTDSEAEKEVNREDAVYVGLADPHTIEVETETETIALQILDPGVEDIDFEEVEPNIDCTIEYYQNEHGQNILTNFEVKE